MVASVNCTLNDMFLYASPERCQVEFHGLNCTFATLSFDFCSGSAAKVETKL